MAAVIGDFVSDNSYFNTMIVNSSIQHQRSHDTSPYRSVSRSRNTSTPRVSRPDSATDSYHQSSSPAPSSTTRASTTAPTSVSSSTSATSSTNINANATASGTAIPATTAPALNSTSISTSTSTSTSTASATAGLGPAHVSATGGASRFPSPPLSSSPSVATTVTPADDAKSASMAPDDKDSRPLDTTTPAAIATSTTTQQQQPSPKSDDLHASNIDYPLSSASSQPPEQTVIHIRDLAHIQSLANADLLSGNGGSGILNDPPLQQMKYEISGMPIGDIIEMVAALLTKITSTNDLQHDAMQRNATHQQQANQSGESSGSAISSLNHSVLAFHGKNVPAITILSYLSRIHKYCPTTYEVFLSLLVYFDRMTERVNDMVTKSEETRKQNESQQAVSDEATEMRDDGDGNSDETDSDLADDDDEGSDEEMTDSGRVGNSATNKSNPTSDDLAAVAAATYFVVDSFNIHRLIISGVTCASKFFSDVFYTNSRYAKVGGLPLVELNHLELQFLLLNDFRLAVPVEDLEAYATMLVEFYAREVVAKRTGTTANV